MFAGGSYAPIVDLSKAKEIIVRDFTLGKDTEKLTEGTYDIGRYNEVIGLFHPPCFDYFWVSNLTK